MSDEVRVTSSTGGQKGTKIERYDLVPVEPLRLLAAHYGKGALKYADNNWRKGYNWSLNYAALCRHLSLFWGGEDIDPETGSPHMVAVAWHAFALLEFSNTHPEFDDRYKGETKEAEEVAETEEAVYPFKSGEVTLLGPELWITDKHNVMSYKGRKFNWIERLKEFNPALVYQHTTEIAPGVFQVYDNIIVYEHGVYREVTS